MGRGHNILPTYNIGWAYCSSLSCPLYTNNILIAYYPQIAYLKQNDQLARKSIFTSDN